MYPKFLRPDDPADSTPGFAGDGQIVRRARRFAVDVTVRGKIGVNRTAFQLRDISTHGARLEGLPKQRIGDEITLILPGLKPKLALVVWSEPDATGVEFDLPLHESAFDSLITRFAVEHHRRVAAGVATASVRHAA